MTELTIDQALQQGIAAHKAGQVQDADRLYTAILKAQPLHPDANHNMGVLAGGVGKVEQALPFFKTALEANPATAQFWLSYIDALIKLDQLTDAKAVLDEAKSKGSKGDGFDKLEQRLRNVGKKPLLPSATALKAPLQHSNILDALKLDQAIKLAKRKSNEGSPEEAKSIYQDVLMKFPKNKRASDGLKRLSGGTVGVANKFHNPPQNQVQALLTLHNQGLLQQVLERAQVLTGQYPEAYIVWNILGAAAAKIGKLDQALFAFRKVISIKPDYADAYNNMGATLRQKGNLKEAIVSYTTALTIKPDYAEAHRNLSNLIKYKPGNPQIDTVAGLLKQPNLDESLRCHLLYTSAKMKEDLNEIEEAYSNYLDGGALRKKLLKYNFLQDQQLFAKIKKNAKHINNLDFDTSSEIKSPTPIFILGMPRSGTTLIEQIISCHSQVKGAGELHFVKSLGLPLVVGAEPITSKELWNFRKSYLCSLAEISSGQPFVTDKMPQNFRFIHLIMKALPEAKIIHVKRNPAATCWSNFKHYFAAKDLGYSYNLIDTVNYFKLYQDLTDVWDNRYGNQIYNLRYDKLTIEQEPETRKLIEHLELDWEDACLSPHKNKRNISTASQLQVNRKVYSGSSQDWRKFEPYLNGVFDEFMTPSDTPHY